MSDDITPLSCAYCHARLLYGEGADSSRCPSCKRLLSESQRVVSSKRVSSGMLAADMAGELLRQMATTPLRRTELYTRGRDLIDELRKIAQDKPPADERRLVLLAHLVTWNREALRALGKGATR
jgi:hypothetical protein